jgi:hypothetical protein
MILVQGLLFPPRWAKQPTLYAKHSQNMVELLVNTHLALPAFCIVPNVEKTRTDF